MYLSKKQIEGILKINIDEKNKGVVLYE